MNAGLISLTFDDGVRSTFEHAAPILARYSMPATVGVICDQLRQRTRTRSMPLEEVRALAESGWEIASHSLFHRRMQKLPLTYEDETALGWRSRGSGLFTAACPWEDVGTVVEDTTYLPRYNHLRPLIRAKSGFFHDTENRLIYVRPGDGSLLDRRLKLGSMERELRESSLGLRALGFDVQSFIAPFSHWKTEWTPLGMRYYSFIVSVVSGRTNLPGRSARLHRIRTTIDSSAEEQTRAIEDQLDQGGWPILCLHDIVPNPQDWLAWSVSEFERLVEWIAKKGLTACTLAEGARRAGISSPAQHTESYICV
jgi:hypothetical protein